MDKATASELIVFILDSIKIIQRRIQGINSGDDFLEGDEGIDKLDAISMRIQSIGEALKNLDKRERELLERVADQQYWSEIIKTRDFISHHYVDIDAETVFDICDNELEVLEQKILQLQEYLDGGHDMMHPNI